MSGTPPRRSPVRTSAHHRDQVLTANARTTRLEDLRGQWSQTRLPAGLAAVPDELTQDQLAAAHDVFRARLRARRDPGATAAALARVRAAQARLDPTTAAGNAAVTTTPPGPSWNPKNSVSASTTEPPPDLRERAIKNGADSGGLGQRYEQRNNRQQQRMRLLDQAREISTLYSMQRCGAMALGGAVAVTQKGDGSGGFSGLFRCGSVWSCPECAPVVRAERAAALETWAGAWLEADHGLAMATLTTRHWSRARLGPQVEGTADAWRRLQQGRWWGDFRARHGLVGVTRAMEMTHSWAHSWHTHLHVLLWTERPMDTAAAADIEAELYERWATLVKAAKLGSPTRKNGVKVDPARRGKEGAADLARYVVKLDEGGSLGNELLRGDMKIGRQKGRTPFEILRRAVRGDEPAELELWHEYETATKGRRMLTWGGDIRAALAELVDVVELDDQAVVELDDVRDTRAVLVQVRPEPWRHTVAAVPGRRGQLRLAVKIASAAAAEARLDAEGEARLAVRDLLQSWGLEWGVDVLGPEVDVDTGEVHGEHVVPPPRRTRRRQEWQTADDLTRLQHLTGIVPRDYVRPDRAARRARGLPVSG